jgi:hypothetical protein
MAFRSEPCHGLCIDLVNRGTALNEKPNLTSRIFDNKINFLTYTVFTNHSSIGY